MIDMLESPRELHELLTFMRDGVLAAHDQAEACGDWSLTSQKNQVMCYANETEPPRPNQFGRPRRQLWTHVAAQEFTGVSPRMHDEFMLQYQLPIVSKYGLVSYGCCENLTRKISMLRQIPNLRMIAVAPSADIARCAQQIQTDYVFSWRPNPSRMVCNGFNPEQVRLELRQGLELAQGCRVHILLKDVETVEHDLNRLADWVAVVRQASEPFKAQENPMPNLTEKDLDQLCRDACEMIGFKSGATVAYDMAGYDRMERIQVVPGSLRPKDYAAQPARPLPAEARFDVQPYPARIAGFQRRAIFGPDEIGRQIGSRSIAWNDGLGNGLYESLRIDRKYGLKHVLEAPILGVPLPYLPEEMPAFRQAYASEIKRFLADLEEIEPVYGGPLARSGERLMVLWCPHYPLSLFAEAYARNPAGVEADLLEQIGRSDVPVRPQTRPERAALARFLALVRRRHGQVTEIQAEMLRQAMGPGLQIAANPHELPPLDMALQGQVFDYPAVAIRPLLVEDDVMLRHYLAYFSQYFHDLAGKAPLISVRMNLSAASPRFIPTPNLIRHWYDQAVRHGAGAFYFWTRDYPYADDPAVYDGPMPGNPDPSVLAKERWQAVIDQLGLLAGRQRFVPPAPEVCILAPEDAALMFREDWRRLYATFSAFAEARIQAGFLSDRAICSGGVPAGVRLLAAPALEFVSPALRAGLEAFSARGGTLLLANQDVSDQAGQPASALAGARVLDAALV